MSNPGKPEGTRPDHESQRPVPASGPAEGMRPGSAEEADSEHGLANPELDHQTSIARPPLGN